MDTLPTEIGLNEQVPTATHTHTCFIAQGEDDFFREARWDVPGRAMDAWEKSICSAV